MKTAVFFTAAMLLALSAAEAANASEIIDRNAQSVRLAVDASGRALTSYRVRGRAMHVLAWGAVDARQPTSGKPQVRFRKDYSGRQWTSFRNQCRAYDGPKLAFQVAACAAPDGSYWALQSWRRTLPNLDGRPQRGRGAWELHLSHWSGPLATSGSVDRLGLRRPLPPPVREAHLRRQARVRLLGVACRLTARRLRPEHLRRHVRLALREGLAAGERVPRSPPDGSLLLRLLPIQLTRPRQRRDVPPDGARPWSHARRQHHDPGTARLRPEQLDGRCVRASSRTPCRTPSPEPTRSATFTDRAAPVVVPRKRAPSVRPRA